MGKISKKNLREQYRERRDQEKKVKRNRKNKKISHKLIKIAGVKSPDAVLIYYPINAEVNPERFFSYLVKENISVILPKVKLDPAHLELFELSEPEKLLKSMNSDMIPSTLHEGEFGIVEPDQSDNIFRRPGEITFALIPGLAFDPSGMRLGYGKGFYDRLLENFDEQTTTLGIAFSFQIFDGKLPSEQHDCRVDRIVTEEELIKID